MLGRPRVGPLVHLQGRGEQVDERLGPGDLLDSGHPLLVVHALGLHRRDRLATGRPLLGVQERAGIVEGRLDDADDVQRVLRRLGVEQVHGGQGEGRERLVEGEVPGKVHRQAQAGAPVRGRDGARHMLHHARRAQ